MKAIDTKPMMGNSTIITHSPEDNSQILPFLRVNVEGNTIPIQPAASLEKPFGDVPSALHAISSFYKDDPHITRVVEFLRPAVDANPTIHFDPFYQFPKDKGSEHFHLGHSLPDGTIGINYAAISDKDTLYRVTLHELIHAVTRFEIEHNKAFRDEISDILRDIRRAFQLPDDSTLLKLFFKKQLINEEKYGVFNEHELIAEAFTNRHFYNYLKKIRYKGDSVYNGDTLLKRVFHTIAKYINKNYSLLDAAKTRTTATNMGDFLLDLTESVINHNRTKKLNHQLNTSDLRQYAAEFAGKGSAHDTLHVDNTNNKGIKT